MILGTFLPSAFSKTESRGKNVATSLEDDDIVEVVPEDTKYIGWAYVGSHNFTPSAWGTLSGSAFNPILNVRHVLLVQKANHGPLSDHELRTGDRISSERRSSSCQCSMLGTASQEIRHRQ